MKLHQNNTTYPKISIITPSLNQGQFIKQAIDSVLNQNYPNFEHIVIDGQSSDNTLDILKQYPHLIWTSKKDKSHIAAVNKGIKKASGEIMTILNSDDYFAPKAFFLAAANFQNPKNQIVCSDCRWVNINGNLIKISRPHTRWSELLQPWRYEFPSNPSSYFYRRSIHQQIGLYSESIGPAYDYDFFLKMAKHYPITYLRNTVLGNYRIHPQSVTQLNKNNTVNDMIGIARKYWGSPFSVIYWQMSLDSIFYPLNNRLRHLIGQLRNIFALRTRLKKITKSLFFYIYL